MKFEISIHNTKCKFKCESNQAIFEAMCKECKDLVLSGCFGGGCGVCKIRILDGKYTVFKRMSRAHISETEEEDNIVLACCIKPDSNLVINKIYKNNKNNGGIANVIKWSN